MHFPLGPRSAKALRIGEEGGQRGIDKYTVQQ